MITPHRYDVLQAILVANRLDALIVSTLVNVTYYTGFTGSNALLLVTAKGPRLFTDPRYTQQASEQVNCPVTIAKGSLLEGLSARVGTLKGLRIGFEDTRASYVLFKALAKLGKLIALGNAIDKPRWVKSLAEIEAIRASVLLNSKALDRSMKRFKVGMTEKELAAEIDHQQRKLGAEGPAFDTIVASGAHSALPHASPRNAPIERGGFLLIDMGACLDGYMSDMTRTFGVGNSTNEQKRIYEAVLGAQLAAIRAVRPGQKASSIHAAAVRHLKQHRLDKLFVHSTGHGLGLEIHESPRLGKKDDSLLEAGMLITIEPGVYEPGVGGVRIEDTLLVTEDGSEVLTPTPKGWTIVD